jgi:tRNA G18 (ribose-2'-O)-methylase SpoU
LPQIDIQSLDEPRLEPYREIRNRNWTDRSGLFIVEGALLVERLLHSGYEVKSLLVDRKFASRFAEMAEANVDLLLVEHELLEQLVGFNFHRGVLGCGLRKPWLSVRTDFALATNPQETLMCLVGVEDLENLGGILRCCSAFGIQRVIIGPGTADPLSRRALRVSMGTVLSLQLYRSKNITEDLKLLSNELGITTVATVLQDDSQPLEQTSRNGPTMILVGNERYGLAADIQAAADMRVKIEMDLGTDSLNVCLAAGITMHYYCRIAK